MKFSANSHTTGSVRAVVVKADGRRIDLGVIAGDERRWWRRLWLRCVVIPMGNRRIRRYNRANPPCEE